MNRNRRGSLYVLNGSGRGLKTRCPHCGAVPASWTPEAILEAARAWREEHGRPPTAQQWKRSSPSHPANVMVTSMFGSWNAMLGAAGLGDRGFKQQKASVWNRDAIVAAVYRWKFQYGRLPRSVDWRTSSDEWPTVYYCLRAFGSWDGTLVAAGYEPRGRRSKRQLRAHMANVTKGVP